MATLLLSELCTDTDVRDRMADLGLATADTEEKVVVEAVNRKIQIAQEKLELEMLSRIQRAIAPYQTDSSDNAPVTTITKLTAASKSLLKTCAVEWTLYYLFEEGETRMRFKWEDAGDAISRTLTRLRNEKNAALDVVWPLLTFDLDANGTITTLERMFTNRLSSVRISA